MHDLIVFLVFQNSLLSRELHRRATVQTMSTHMSQIITPPIFRYISLKSIPTQILLQQCSITRDRVFSTIGVCVCVCVCVCESQFLFKILASLQVSQRQYSKSLANVDFHASFYDLFPFPLCYFLRTLLHNIFYRLQSRMTTNNYICQKINK